MLSYCNKSMAYLKVEADTDEDPQVSPGYTDIPAIYPLGHSLAATYLANEGDFFSYVANRHIEEAGLSLEELHTRAVANLTKFVEQRVEVPPYGNIFSVLCGGHFEASILMVDRFWTEWYSQLIQNGFAVAFPARDLLAFGDVASNTAISELKDLCKRVANKVDHPLTLELYKRVGHSWQPLGGQPLQRTRDVRRFNTE